MLKIYLRIIALLLMSVPMAAQQERKESEGEEEGDITFDDGTVINFKMLNNDPETRTDWLLLGSLTPIYFESTVNVSLGLEGKVNLWDVANLYGSTRAGLTLDFNMTDEVDYSDHLKIFNQHVLETSIRVHESVSHKKSGIVLRETMSGNLSTTYVIYREAGYKERYGIVAGIEKVQRRVNSEQSFESSDSTSTTPYTYIYRPTGLTQRNLRLGFDFLMSTSFLIEIDGTRRMDYQETRLYGVVLVPLSQQMDVVRYHTDVRYDNEPELVDEGFQKPGLTGLGYAMGVEGAFNRSSKRSYLGFGLEVGILPGIDYGNVFKNFTARLGLKYGFGSDLFKKMNEEKM